MDLLDLCKILTDSILKIHFLILPESKDLTLWLDITYQPITAKFISSVRRVNQSDTISEKMWIICLIFSVMTGRCFTWNVKPLSKKNKKVRSATDLKAFSELKQIGYEACNLYESSA